MAKQKSAWKRTYIARAALLAAMLLLTVGCFGDARADTPASVDALRYNMQLRLDVEQDRLYEQVAITLKNNMAEPVTALYLRDMTGPLLQYAADFYAEDGNEHKTSAVTGISLRGTTESPSVTYAQENSLLRVELAPQDAVLPGKTAVIDIEMYTDIPNRQDRFGMQIRDAGKLYALSFCFPYLADNQNGVWNTDPFFDDGESRSADLADYCVTLEAPSSFVVAATGESATQKGTTVISAAQVRDFAIVACDFMDVDRFDVDGVRVNNYYLQGGYTQEYRTLSKLAAQDSLRLFSQQVGPYLYDELDLVECLFGFAFGGMEYPGLVMINGTSHYDGIGPIAGALSLAEVIAHEIGHQWFYAAVGNNEYAEAWLDEGFTTYLTEEVFGLADCETNDYIRRVDAEIPSLSAIVKEREEYRQWSRLENETMYINVSPADYSQDDMYGEREYEGAYFFLLDIKDHLGKERFDDFLKTYYQRYCFKIATTQDVVNLLRQYDDSETMESILRYYLQP